MAIIDSRVEFGVNQDLSQVAGTYLFTNQYDIGKAGIDIGSGEVLYLNLVVTEAFASGGAATVNFRLRSDDTAAIADSASSGHLESGAIPIASLTLGTQLSFPIPLANAVPFERYLGLQAVIAAATTTAGTVTAWIGESQIGGWKAYEEGIN